LIASNSGWARTISAPSPAAAALPCTALEHANPDGRPRSPATASCQHVLGDDREVRAQDQDEDDGERQE